MVRAHTRRHGDEGEADLGVGKHRIAERRLDEHDRVNRIDRVDRIHGVDWRSSSSGTTSTTGGSTAVPPGTDTADSCPPGQGIPQGTYAGDGDEDNIGMPTDGDGCL